MISVDLFAGCGGLAYGIAEAGFHHVLVVERDPEASKTLLSNKRRGVRHFRDWTVEAKDAREVDYSPFAGRVDLVTGGPPCQPFSIGGSHKGPTDARNMWLEAIRTVRELRPKAFLFENVRGLLRPSFNSYLEFLRLQLTWPELKAPGRGWVDHGKRLAKREERGTSPTYHVVIKGINAADYGAPQRRHRAMIMGIRADIADTVPFPAETHSQERLVWSQRVTFRYWDEHDIPKGKRPAVTEPHEFILERLRNGNRPPPGKRWTTVRDAIGDLPAPCLEKETIANHHLHPGARLYARHTGSSLDEPAKALKAGDHGVPGGENTLVGPRGAVRYFTLREMIRLQGLPDPFQIGGTWKGPIKQLGNAVPVQVGRVFGTAIREALETAES